MPGLELIGPIAGCPQVVSQDPVVAGVEETGLFVAGDANIMRNFSGMDLGWRWLCRAQGPLVKANFKAFPKTPRNHTFDYFPSEAEARAYYALARQAAMQLQPGVTAEDTRQNFPLNVPSAYAESFWHNGQEVMRLMFDRMADLQVFSGNTDTLGIFPATPNGAPIVSYFTQNQVLYFAIARGATGAAEHVVLVFSDEHKPNPIIPQGMPRAEWMTKFNQAGLRFGSNTLVVQWARLSGQQTLAQEDPQNPAASLLAKMGQNVVIPLPAPADIAQRLGGVPPGYAVKLEPGSYTCTYYELMGTEWGGFSCCAISREGAPSFMPVVLGNAGGIVHGGLTVEQYAMLSTERDNLIMTRGPMAAMGQEMAQLCAKYNVPFQQNGMGGRIQGWELMIQGDASFSAQWAMQRGAAMIRLQQNREPTEAELQAMAQQQQAVTTQLEQHNKNHKERMRGRHDASIEIIQFALGKTGEQVGAEVRRIAPNFQPSDILGDCLRMLERPNRDKNPKFDNVDKRLEPIVRAHWPELGDKDRSRWGTPEKYLKNVIGDVYPPNGLKVPGLFGFLKG